MSSQPRTAAREEERRLNIQTLVIASLASAAAAAVTSQFWTQGTWVAAAITPVIVALVSEMLDRPTTAIAERVTSRGTNVVPGTGPADGPPRAGDRAPAEPGSQAAPVRVYRSGTRAKPGAKPVRPQTRRRRIAVGAVALTAVLAFAIAALALTGTELLTGGSIGKGSGDTTLFSGSDETDKASDDKKSEQPDESQPQDGSSTDQDTQEQPQQTQPSEEPPPESQPQPAPQTPEVPAPQQP